VDSIPYSFERTSDVSRITIMFYGLIKDSLYVNTRFAPKNEVELKQFDDLYQRFDDSHFLNSTVKSRVNDFIQEMSFIK